MINLDFFDSVKIWLDSLLMLLLVSDNQEKLVRHFYKVSLTHLALPSTCVVPALSVPWTRVSEVPVLRLQGS